MDITKEEWYERPFDWYEKHKDRKILGIAVSRNHTLDFMQVLADIYEGLVTNNKQQAIEDIEVLATLLIATSLGYSEHVVEELLVRNLNDDMDKFLDDLLEEGK